MAAATSVAVVVATAVAAAMIIKSYDCPHGYSKFPHKLLLNVRKLLVGFSLGYGRILFALPFGPMHRMKIKIKTKTK